MHLTIREEERIQIWAMASMARQRYERGILLNCPEAIALICDEVLERAREGQINMVTELIEYGRHIVKREDVMEGVPELIPMVQVESVMRDGTKLVSIENPIRD